MRVMAAGLCKGTGLALLACLLLPVPSSAAGEDTHAYAKDEVRSAMIYRLLHFVRWPGDRASGELGVCILPSARDNAALNALAGRKVNGRSIRVLPCSGVCRACSVRLFRGQPPEPAAGVLDIAIEDGTDAMVALVEDGGRIVLSGHPALWRREGIELEARLLRVMRLDEGVDE